MQDERYRSQDLQDDKMDSFYKRLDYSDEVWEKFPVKANKHKKI